MGEFDKILKENIEAIFLSLVEKMLGLSINATGILQRSPVDLWGETFHKGSRDSFGGCLRDEVKDKIQTTISHGILWMNGSRTF